MKQFLWEEKALKIHCVPFAQNCITISQWQLASGMICSLKVISLRSWWRWKWFKKTNRGGVKNNLKGHLLIVAYPFSSLHFIAVHLFPPGLWKTLLLAHWPAPLQVSLHPSIPLDLEFPWPPGSAQLWKVVATAAACFAAFCEYWQELTNQ